MRFLASVGVAAALVPLSAHAVCVVEPLEPQLRSADVVYVGTVVRSELVDSLESVKASNSPRARRVQIRHLLQPEITLKGDPALTPTVLSSWQYNPPTSKKVVEFAERELVMPGDTLLVVARANEPTYLGLCAATRKWNAEVAKSVNAILRPAP